MKEWMCTYVDGKEEEEEEEEVAALPKVGISFESMAGR